MVSKEDRIRTYMRAFRYLEASKDDIGICHAINGVNDRLMTTERMLAEYPEMDLFYPEPGDERHGVFWWDRCDKESRLMALSMMMVLADQYM